MTELFTTLGHSLQGAPLVALGASFLWGVLSVVLSPCHLASIPLIVGFISGQGLVAAGRAFRLSLLFAVGILITVAAIGGVTAAAGRMLGDVGAAGNFVVAGIFFLVGLHLMEVVPLPLPDPAGPGIRRKGALAALLLGLVFGLALGPCTFAFMAPMLAVTFKLAGTDPVFGGLLLLAYGLGHCAVIVVAGTSSGLVQRFLDWSSRSSGSVLARKICGGLILAAGVYLIHAAP